MIKKTTFCRKIFLGQKVNPILFPIFLKLNFGLSSLLQTSKKFLNDRVIAYRWFWVKNGKKFFFWKNPIFPPKKFFFHPKIIFYGLIMIIGWVIRFLCHFLEFLVGMRYLYIMVKKSKISPTTYFFDTYPFIGIVLASYG